MPEVYEVKIKGLTLDPLTKMPIIILKDVEGKRSLPIWIGIFEANAIALEIEKVVTPRPMTHDLMIKMLESLGSTISRVIVHDLKDNTFYASVVIERNGNEYKVDSRPSDAIALAVRTGSPILVTQEVMEKSQSFDFDEDINDDAKLKEWLDNLKPEDFGRYPA